MNSKRNIVRVAACALLALVLLGGVASALPVFSFVVSFQGRLSTPDGKPLPDGAYSVRFRVYSVSERGAVLWTETQTVTQTGGVFAVQLGTVTPFPTTLFTGGDRWLGIAVGGENEMLPRIQFTPTPWAIRAASADEALNADTLDGAHAGNAAGNVPLNNGTLSTTLNADKLDGADAGNASGNVALNNAALCVGLCADRIDLFHASSTPGPNFLLPLDSTSKFPASVIPPDDDWTISGSNIYRSTGNVGVGLTVPDVKLQVAGGADVSLGSGGYMMVGLAGGRNLVMDSNEIQARNAGAAAAMYLNYNGGLVRAGNSSYVGTGLSVLSSGQYHAGATLRVDNPATEGGLATYMTNDSNWATAIMKNTGPGQVLILERDDSAADFLVCNNAGGAGHVFKVGADGYTTVSVLEITGGSDLSEQFRVSTPDVKPVPGMVVCIDPAKPGDLVLSTKAYDRGAAGIISGAGGVKPGMRMGQTDTIADGDHPVALTGRVWCWCDASNGAIEPTDMLTTSATPGHAMKASDRDKAQGAIIGKAMTSLKSGRGLVLVLVGLQ